MEIGRVVNTPGGPGVVTVVTGHITFAGAVYVVLDTGAICAYHPSEVYAADRVYKL